MQKLANTTTLTHEEWLELRKKGIGGSDIGKILGLSNWGSPLSVFVDKTTPVQESDEENLAMELGLELEPFLRRKFERWVAKEEGIEVCIRRNNFVLADDKFSYMIADIDGDFVHPTHGRTGVELKTVSEMGHVNWKDDEIPDQYYAQVQWYLMVTGYKIWYLVYLVGNRKLGVKIIERNDEFIENMRGQAVDFWNNFILTNTAPSPIGKDVDHDAILALWPTETAGEQIEYTDPEVQKQLAEVMDGYDKANEMKHHIDAIIKEGKQYIEFLMKDAETMLFNGRKFTFKTTNRKAYTVEAKSYRSLLIGKVKNEVAS